MPLKSIQPTQKLERIPSLDFLRGIAILGILFINIESFSYPDPWSPWKYGFANSIDHATRFWVYFLTQGKFYNMFALLFGVGFYIFLERLEKKNLGLKAMDIYARRLLWLFVIGIVHAYFIWPGDVLYHYAICGLLLFPFRSISNTNLLAIVALLCVLQLVKSYDLTMRKQGWLDDYITASKIPEKLRTPEDIRKIEFWQEKLKQQVPDTSHVDMVKETYLSGLKENYKNASAHKGLLYYQGLLFPSLIAMIMGIVLYRSGIFVDYHVWKFYWPISLGVLVIGLIINYLRYDQWTYAYFDPVLSIWEGWLFTFPKEVLGIAYVMVFNGIYQKYLRAVRFRVISAVGQMALTNYIFQNILLGLIFYGYGLARFNCYSRFELLGIVVIIWIVQIAFSWLWMKKFKQGPLEWLWRKLTYNSFKSVKQH